MTINDLHQAMNNIKALRAEIEALGATITMSVSWEIAHGEGETTFFVRSDSEWVEFAKEFLAQFFPDTDEFRDENSSNRASGSELDRVAAAFSAVNYDRDEGTYGDEESEGDD
jgi:hypothetical protein